MQTAAYQESTRIQVNDHGESLKHSILKILAYFDVFHYPLLKSEIKQFLDQLVIEQALDKMLLILEQERTIFRLDQFYSLRPDPLLEQKRKEGNLRAGSLLAKGTRIGRFLFQFPGVRAIAISGSLSKNHAPEKADIDFFIITGPNRLWIARTFMHLFKKLTFLTGSHHFYCMNYYIDQLALEVPDKNIYNAIEIKTLMPVCGKKAMDEFI